MFLAHFLVNSQPIFMKFCKDYFPATRRLREIFIVYRGPTALQSKLGTSEEVILVFSSCFFQDLCEFVIHCNKIHIFLCVCLFFLLTITGTNEAIIVEFKKLFVLNGTFITCSWGSHH